MDNNSSDSSCTELVGKFAHLPNFTLVQNSENLGFAGANNQGAELAIGEYLYFLNSDTEAAPESTEVLVNFLKTHSEIGAIGPRVFNADGSDQASTGPFATKSSLTRHYLPLKDLLLARDKRVDFVPPSSMKVDIVKGCALCVSRKAFDQIGGWDDSYFLYSEETELCLALNKAGYSNYFLREAEIMHHGGASTSQENYADQQIVQHSSLVQYLHRHSNPSTRLVHRLAGLVGFGARSVLFPIYSALNPRSRDNYKLRLGASRKLFKWFLLDYPRRESDVRGQGLRNHVSEN